MTQKTRRRRRLSSTVCVCLSPSARLRMRLYPRRQYRPHLNVSQCRLHTEDRDRQGGGQRNAAGAPSARTAHHPCRTHFETPLTSPAAATIGRGGRPTSIAASALTGPRGGQKNTQTLDISIRNQPLSRSSLIHLSRSAKPPPSASTRTTTIPCSWCNSLHVSIQ